jgi:hypothetical protein
MKQIYFLGIKQIDILGKLWGFFADLLYLNCGCKIFVDAMMFSSSNLQQCSYISGVVDWMLLCTALFFSIM